MYVAHPKESFYNKKKNNRWGMYARRDFSTGETVGILKGFITERTRTSIEFFGMIYEPTNGMGCMNHSCFPNAKFTAFGLIAIRDIICDDEITFDYTDNETEISAPFDCTCGAETCKGRIE